jgi:hypothetical protein
VLLWYSLELSLRRLRLLFEFRQQRVNHLHVVLLGRV